MKKRKSKSKYARIWYEGFEYEIRPEGVFGRTGAMRNEESDGAFTDDVIVESYAEEIREAAREQQPAVAYVPADDHDESLIDLFDRIERLAKAKRQSGIAELAGRGLALLKGKK